MTLTRRTALGRLAAAGLGALGAAAIVPTALPAERRWRPQDPDTPAAALQALRDGNARFVAGQPLAPRRNPARVQEVATSQHPFAAFLSCADSRVPVELVFDQGFGDCFVVRNAGNVATPEEIASLEFGTAVLGAKVLMVMGHTACGAVAATARAQSVPGQISVIYQHIRPAVEAAGGDVERAVVENVRIQARLLRDASTVIADLVRQDRLRVVGGVYELATGRVRTVET